MQAINGHTSGFKSKFKFRFAIPNRAAMPHARQGRDMTMERFFGGSPLTIIFKLAITSIIIVVILSFFGFNPVSLYDAVIRLGNWISSLGLDALTTVLRYLVLGGIIVIPLWLLSRVFSLFGSQKQD